MTPAAAAVEQPGGWGWAACGASATGALHERRGQGCDDAYSYGIAEDFVIAAVADGAGSVSGTSAWGAYAACQSVLEHAMLPAFIGNFQSGTAEQQQTQMRWLFDRALERVRGQADALSLDVSLLSTTLCIALADHRRAIFGQIGDGVIASETDGRIDTLLTEPKGEYANTTWFLQSDRAFEAAFRTAAQDGVTAFALSTDGMSYKITDIATGAAYEPFFRGSWEHVRSGASAAHFAALLRGIEDDQTGDDKTMVLAAVRWEADEFHPSPRPVRKTMVSSAAPRPHHAPSATPDSGTGDRAEAATDPVPLESTGRRRRLFGGRYRQ